MQPHKNPRERLSDEVTTHSILPVEDLSSYPCHHPVRHQFAKNTCELSSRGDHSADKNQCSHDARGQPDP
eukprot:scaffold3277_cov110-Skeletonema_dohrnii-CCMP3373.AAC.2